MIENCIRKYTDFFLFNNPIVFIKKNLKKYRSYSNSSPAKIAFTPNVK